MLPVEESQGKPEELRFSVTGRAAKRLLVNLLLREYKVYKQGKWEQGKLPEPEKSTEPKRPRLSALKPSAPGRRRVHEVKGGRNVSEAKAGSYEVDEQWSDLIMA